MNICCSGKLIDFKIPKIMGILNITPNSFYDGGRYTKKVNMLKHVEKMLNDGADFIDIGGISTRPGGKKISLEDEFSRVINTIKIIIKHFPDVKISVDTFRNEVAYAAIQVGAQIINDISGGIDKKIFKIVSNMKIPYVLTHIKGKIHDIEQIHKYKINPIIDINNFFSKKIFKLNKMGINDIILDPGFGFGKQIKDSIKILKNLSLLGFGDYPILIGISRKSIIQNILNINVHKTLNSTSIMHTLAILQNISILRVHDVKESMECIKVIKTYKKY